MRVLVLGASGFLGSWTVRALIEQGHEVCTVTRQRSNLWRLAELAGDFELHCAEPRRWPRLIESLAPESVLSLDWNGAATTDHNLEPVQASNLARQAELVSAAIRAGAKRIVGVGSQTEYGPRSGVLSESSPAGPVTEYGRAKVRSLENLALLASSAGVEWVWARVFSIYGPLDADGRLLPSVFDSIQQGKRMALSPAEQAWSFLFAGDAGRALAVLARHDSASGIYNVAHLEAPTLKQSLVDFARALGGEEFLDFGGLQPGDNSAPRTADVSRLSALGWKPALSRLEGLELTAEWLGGRAVADPLVAGRYLPRRRVTQTA